MCHCEEPVHFGDVTQTLISLRLSNEHYEPISVFSGFKSEEVWLRCSCIPLLLCWGRLSFIVIMTTSRKDDWLTFMSNSPLNQLANEHMNDVLSLAKFQKEKQNILSSTSINPGLAMLLVDGFSELVILHNLDCLPANVFRSKDKLVALNGVSSKADCYWVDPVSAFQDLEFATPLWRELKNAMMEEAIQNLHPQDQSSSLFKGKQVMIVPPLVSVTILETKS